MVVYANIKLLKKKIIEGQRLSEDEIVYICLNKPFEVVDSFYEEKSDVDIRSFRIILKIENKYYSLFYYKERHIYEETVYPPQIAVKVTPIEIKRIEWIEDNKE